MEPALQIGARYEHGGQTRTEPRAPFDRRLRPDDQISQPYANKYRRRNRPLLHRDETDCNFPSNSPATYTPYLVCVVE